MIPRQPSGVAFVAQRTYRGPAGGFEKHYGHEFANAEAIANLPGSPDRRPAGRTRWTAPSDAGAARTTPDVCELGPRQRYGLAVNLVAQLRLCGITVRFADEPDDGIVFMRRYPNEHQARGDEDVVLL